MKKKTVFERWAKEEKEILAHEQTITIRVGDEKIDLDLYHNFDFLHLDIYKAVDEWGMQTDTFTSVNFCQYIMTQPSRRKLLCVPKDEWNDYELNQNGIQENPSPA